MVKRHMLAIDALQTCGSEKLDHLLCLDRKLLPTSDAVEQVFAVGSDEDIGFSFIQFLVASVYHEPGRMQSCKFGRC